MVKKDLNFIKHIKPIIKEKVRRDKEESRQKQGEKAMRMIGLDPPAITMEDLGWMMSAMRFLKSKGK